METSLGSQPCFCLFCYKNIDSSLETTENSDITQQFVTVVSRYVKSSNKNKTSLQISKLLEKLFDVNNLVRSCKRCTNILVDFCTKYHQLQILQMELDWKLDKLVEKMNYANKVPARWIHIGKVLEEVCQKDSGDKVECQKSIRKFRQNIVDQAQNRRQAAQPRVFVKRADQSNIPNEPVDSRSPSSTQKVSENSDPIIIPRISMFRKLHPDKKCPKCGKQLKTFKGLQLHLENHKDSTQWKFKCAQCDKKFSNHENLKVHSRSHSGDKPYECRFCGQKVRYRHCYNKHMNIFHRNEKDFEEEYNKTFESNKVYNLQKEKSKIKKGRNPKIYECLKCDKIIKTFRGYEIHLTLHNDRSSFKWKCDQCGKRFASEGNLEVHSRTHSGVLPFKCKFCGKSIRYKNSLNRHLKAMHNDEDTLEMELKRKWIRRPRIYKKGKKNKSVEMIEPTKFLDTDDVEFGDPLIQVKIEPVTLADIDDEVLEQSISTILHSTDLSETMVKNKCQENEKTNCVEKVVPKPVVEQTKRYSLREKRTRNFEIFDTDDDEYDEKDDRDQNKSMKSLSSKSISKTSGIRNPIIKGLTDLKCEVCLREFEDFTKKLDHFKRCHDLEGKSKDIIKIKCTFDNCTAYFLSAMQLQGHRRLEHSILDNEVIRVHKKPLVCKYCGKTFKFKTYLRQHMKRHREAVMEHSQMNEVKVECIEKEEEGEFVNDLDDNNDNHSSDYKSDGLIDGDTTVDQNEERVFKCGTCGDIFSDRSFLEEHLEHHKEEEKDDLEDKIIEEKDKEADLVENDEETQVQENIMEGLGDEMDISESENMNLVTDEMVNEDMFIFARKADNLGNETLVELEDLD